MLTQKQLNKEYNNDKSVDAQVFETVCKALAYNEDMLLDVFTVRNSTGCDFLAAYIALMENKFDTAAVLLKHASGQKCNAQETENYLSN